MNELHEIVVTKGRRASLDRVHRAEHCIDDLGMVITVLDREETAFQFCELLLALLEESLLDGFQMVQDRLRVITR